MFPPRFSILCWSLSEPFFTVMAANWSFFPPTPPFLPHLTFGTKFSLIFSVWNYQFLFFPWFITSHYCLIIFLPQLPQILPVDSSCPAVPLFFFFFLIWWGVIPYFLTKLSYFVFLLQPWNQPPPLGAWFLLLVNGIKDQDLGCRLYSGLLGSFSKPYPFLDSFLPRGLTWSSEVSMNSF